MSVYHKISGSLPRIRLLLLDVDGVLTDGNIGLGLNGDEIKFFSVQDGLGIRLAQRAGWEVAFLSGRSSGAVTRRAAELGVKTVIQGSKDKLRDFQAILDEKGLEAKQVAYMGDDLPDLPVLRKAGFAVAPDNAAEQVKYSVHYVTRSRGGRGAVREFIDLLLKSSGKLEQAATFDEDLAEGRARSA